ncbi:MAG: PIN domain-containing protein [Candidatus Thiosymbion ectosymbiont of Robbea hypermnestra]|nr:PIN domain-containing protein [Candidatus Thiosymbion ectosymbiont of Robbea hypermnestra]
MNGILIDSCVLLDLFTDDKNWADWSESTLETYSRTNTLYINSIVYAEVSIGFNKVEEVEAAIDSGPRLWLNGHAARFGHPTGHRGL